MLQGHAFESWLHPAYRGGEMFWLSQFLGGFPAPIFLFLVGVSMALILDRMRQKGASTWALFVRVARRGSWFLLLAYLYRIEQYWIWRPASRWADVFRVDTLNCIAATTLVVGMISLMVRTRRCNLIVMGVVGITVVIITPLVHSIRSDAPSILLDYFNGNGRGSYFSVFPWTAFAIAGMTFGYGLLEARARNKERRYFEWVVVCGILACAVGMMMSFFPIFEYGSFDYSITSPHFFLIRLGWLSTILYGAYHWSLRASASNWSPLRTFGQSSLIVYWVHMELVYGRPLHEFSRSLDLFSVARQLVWLIPSMLLLAAARQYGFGRIAMTAWKWVGFGDARSLPASSEPG
jgi:uncharacterized membrane protein